MKNLGSRWLHYLSLQDADVPTKICALTALDMQRGSSEGIWDGNIEGAEDAISEVRHALIHTSNVAVLMRVIRKPVELIEEFDAHG